MQNRYVAVQIRPSPPIFRSRTSPHPGATPNTKKTGPSCATKLKNRRFCKIIRSRQCRLREKINLPIWKDIADLNEKRSKLDAVSPTFCLAKWKHVTLHLHKGRTQSCCLVKSHKINPERLSDPLALHNTPEKLQARSEILHGKRVPECGSCWRVEDIGQMSERIYKSTASWNWKFFDQVVREGIGEATVPSTIEVAFNSICQFKCIYCGPEFSTKWQKEIEEYGPYPTDDHQASIDILNPDERVLYVETFWRLWRQVGSKINRLRLTGGEPFLMPETFQLIDELIKNPHPLIFSINTNLGIGPQVLDRFLSKVPALQESVSRLALFASIDTVGPQAEYIRFGLDYQAFRKNVEKILESTRSSFHLTFMVTANNLCLPGLQALMAYIHELRLRFPLHQIDIDPNILRHPRHMTLAILPREFARYLDGTIDFMKTNNAGPARFSEIEIKKMERVRDMMLKHSLTPSEQINLRRDFYKMFKEYDRRRGTDFLATFPEYRAFWNLCHSLTSDKGPSGTEAKSV